MAWSAAWLRSIPQCPGTHMSDISLVLATLSSATSDSRTIRDVIFGGVDRLESGLVIRAHIHLPSRILGKDSMHVLPFKTRLYVCLVCNWF